MNEGEYHYINIRHLEVKRVEVGNKTMVGLHLWIFPTNSTQFSRDDPQYRLLFPPDFALEMLLHSASEIEKIQGESFSDLHDQDNS